MRLKEEKEALYSDGQTLMERVTVTKVDKEKNIAILSNRITVQRIDTNGEFLRVDGKKGFALPLTEKTEQLWNKYVLYHQSKKALEEAQNHLKKGWRECNIEYLTKIANLR